MIKLRLFLLGLLVSSFAPHGSSGTAQTQSPSPHPIVLHAARMLDVKNGLIVKPGEVLVEGDRIVEVGSAVKRRPGRR